VTALTFDELFRKHQSWLVRYVANRVRPGDNDVADDIAQVAFLRAWRALPAARLESAEAERAWLCTIARHVLADHYGANATRQRAREESTDPTDVTAWHADARGAIPDDADRVCAVVDIARSTAAVTAEHRRLVALRLIGETSWAVLAGATRQGKGTVRRLTAEATAGVIW